MPVEIGSKFLKSKFQISLIIALLFEYFRYIII